MLQRLTEDNYELEEVTGTSYTEAVDMNQVSTLSVQSVIDVNTPAAKTFPFSDVNTGTDAITEIAHGFFTGLKGQFTTTGGLPAGISAVTDYFIVVLTADTFQVATTLENAIATPAVVVDITTQGTGNHTFTPTALAGATISFQRSNVVVDNEASTTAADWADIDTATGVTVDATVWYSVVGPTWRWFRVKGFLTAGSMTIQNYVLSRGESKS
jgi:hypothetical protein